MRNAITFLSFFVLTACSFNVQHGSSSGEFLRRHQIAFLDAADFGESAFLLHAVQIEDGKTHQSLLMQSEIEPDRLAIAVVSPLGRKYFTAELVGGRSSYAIEPFAKISLSPNQLMQMFQMIYWPLDVLRKELAENELIIEEKILSHSVVRGIYSGDQLLIKIQYDNLNVWDAVVLYKNSFEEYTVKFETIEYARQ